MEKPEDGRICEQTVKHLREQKHDFMNHLQVLQAYLELGKLDRLETYMQSVVKELAEHSYDSFTCEHKCCCREDKEK